MSKMLILQSSSLQLCSESAPLSLVQVPQILSTDNVVTSLGLASHVISSRETAPQPSPLPTLARDSQLSCVSLMDRVHNAPSSHSSEDTLSVHSQSATRHNSSLEQLTVFPGKVEEPSSPSIIIKRQERQLRTVQLQVWYGGYN